MVMKIVIVIFALTFVLIFGLRFTQCQKLNDTLANRLDDIDENYWVFKRYP